MRSTLPLLLSSLAMPVWAEAPKVMADLVPVHSLVAQVMEGVGEPDLLLPAGADAHSFQLRPSQAAALAEADLVVWIGPEMTPWLDRALDTLGEDANQLDLIHAEGTKLRDYEDGHEDHHDEDHASHDEEHGHGDDHDEHGHEHDHNGTDPHAWLNPENARLWLGVIADQLAALDPENAEVYRANATAAQDRLGVMDREITAQLAPAKDKAMVVFHDAYGYFTDHYGLGKVMAVAGGDAAAPGAAHLTELREVIASAGPICLFPEAQHDPALINSLAEATKARIGAPLDPEGSLVDPGAGAYEALLRGLAAAIAGCLAP